MRIAWFSPLPPTSSGIAAYSAELLPFLRSRYDAIDVYTENNARDFVWRQRRTPYDLTVFQMGNAACHDYMWAYLFRYPGLVVIHDLQLHQARALMLLRRLKPRRADYFAEFHANHPDAPPEAAALIAAGLGGSLYQLWPFLKLVIERARLTVVHNGRVRDWLREQYPGCRIESIEMGVKDAILERRKTKDESRKLRARHGIPDDAVVVAAFGGMTPEKRIPQLLQAMRRVMATHQSVHLMLVGPHAEHYDVSADIRHSGCDDRIHVTGYVGDGDLPRYLSAADVCACLRWPTNRETSASWVRCLAAGKPTIVTALAHMIDVPMLDANDWTDRPGAAAISVDVLDEERLLSLVMERLVTDQPLRERLSARARDWWMTHHQLAPMADAYAAAINRAAQLRSASPALPHLLADGTAVLQQFGNDPQMRERLAGLID